MKINIRIYFIAIIMLGLCSCNSKIDNPSETNLIGTWDHLLTEVITDEGTVANYQGLNLSLVFTDSYFMFRDESGDSQKTNYYYVKDNNIYTDSYFMFHDESGDSQKMYNYYVKDNNIYLVDSKLHYHIDNLTRKEMILSLNYEDLITIIVYFKKR